jgi:hypothetical protein
MAAGFEVEICLSESCNGITVKDVTGFFSAENPFSYNAPNPSVPTLLTSGVFGYTEYVLSLFYAIQGGYDDTQAPDYTVDLLTWPHTVDVDTGYVTWEFTFADLGITDETLRSGWWLGRLDPVTWVNGTTYDYSRDETFAFTGDITSMMDTAMAEFIRKNGFDGGCDCGCGGEAFMKLYLRYRVWRDNMACANMEEAFQETADYLYTALPQCQC